MIQVVYTGKGQYPVQFHAGGQTVTARAGGTLALPDHVGRALLARYPDRFLAQDHCQAMLDDPGIGVLALGAAITVPGFKVVSGHHLHLPFSKTIVLTAGIPSHAVLRVGLALLKAWQVAVPLLSYETLARDLGTEADRAVTERLLPDLRVPVYDSRVLFVRRSSTTLDLVQAFTEELTGGDHRDLAFLRAVQRVKPLLCPLPPLEVA